MSNNANYSDSIDYEIDQEMQNIVKTQYERRRKILTEHQEQLNLIAETLIEIETLDREQIEGLFYHGKLPERSLDNEPEEDETVSESVHNDKAGASYEEVKDKMDSADTAQAQNQEEQEGRQDMVEPPKPEGDTEDPSVDRNNDERNNR